MRPMILCSVLLLAGCDGDDLLPHAPVDMTEPDALAPREEDAYATDGGTDADGGHDASPDADSDADAGLEPDSGALTDSGVVDSDGGTDAPDDAAPCQLAFFRDADGDGFGDPAEGSCLQLLGYVSNAGDCYDGNANAWPGKTGSFSMHRGDGSFDYDCDGAETGHNDRVAVCPDMSMATCPPTPHRRPWYNCDYIAQTAPWHEARDAWSRAIPKCGTLGVYGLHIWWEVSLGRYQCAEMPENSPPQSQQLRGCH